MTQTEHVSSSQPLGQPGPVDAVLPSSAYDGMNDRSLSFYVHVPFCAARCGYCDFNTYTPAELGSEDASSTASWLSAALAEIEMAARVLGSSRPVSTVFVGGGTPSLLGWEPLALVLSHIRSHFGLVPKAEVTTEANPESTDGELLDGLAQAGFTRLSLGLQSTAPHVLQLLERRHTPDRAFEVLQRAREAGFQHLNLDLIYGTPGETEADFGASLSAVLASGVDHVSAYSLIVEPGTRLARRVRSGAVPMPDEDVLADRYLQAENLLAKAGFSWYEVSNWARDTSGRCRHNLAYWKGGDWWGVGPGAHSHVGGVRWWNVKHPRTYSNALRDGRSPSQAREILTPAERATEAVMLGLRLAEGIDLESLPPVGRREALRAVHEGLLTEQGLNEGKAVLTLQGRLLADGIALRLLG
jgi:putative oxygen-independent coproporphyrinogen III oxidase